MSLRKSLLTLAALPLALGGCGSAGTPMPGWPSGTPAPAGTPWIVTVSGSATPSPSMSGGGSRRPALPPVSFLAAGPDCAQYWRMGDVLIPLQVTAAKGALVVTWPRQYGSNYRITAVPQRLVSGNQPANTWQNVAPGTGCTMSATITGLTSGRPYIVWLDAPNTGFERDGTRHLYSGRSAVVFPL